MSPQRLLHGFINDTHPAAPNLAQHAVITQLHRRGGIGLRLTLRIRPRLHLCSAVLFDEHKRRQDFLQLAGQLRILLCVFRDRRPFPAPVTLDKLLRESIDGMSFRLQGVHALLPPKPGMLSSMSFNRTSARPYRWLAASSRKPSTWAVS